MKLDRSDPRHGGKGKYAVVRLRTIEVDSEAHEHLQALDRLGVLDWGIVGQPDEFFVIKLRDKYAGAAIGAYANAVHADAMQTEDEAEHKAKVIYGLDVLKLCDRAGTQSPFCKVPD